MNAPTLENERVKLSRLTKDNYVELLKVSQQKDLIYYSPSDISTGEACARVFQTISRYPEHSVRVEFLSQICDENHEIHQILNAHNIDGNFDKLSTLPAFENSKIESISYAEIVKMRP